LIQKYFPESEWDRADCIAAIECVAGPCQSSDKGLVDCGGPGPVYAKAWGVFGILDACWSPYYNPSSPFTRDEWDHVLDPEYNVWMASVIWSLGGWKVWTTCSECNACDIPGGPVPCPGGPLSCLPPPQEGAGMVAPLLLGLVFLGGAIVLIEARKK